MRPATIPERHDTLDESRSFQANARSVPPRANRTALLVGSKATTIEAVPDSATAAAGPTDATREELAREATRAWSDARSFLFVCLGNVCRSPFAEGLALRQSGGRHASSAGHYPVSGRRPPELAVEVAQGFDVDLASHRSRVLSRSMVEQADAVFVFGQDNYEAVISHHPRAAERTHQLGALCHEGPLHIADPFGGPAALYEDVYRQIAAAVAAGEQARG